MGKEALAYPRAWFVAWRRPHRVRLRSRVAAHNRQPITPGRDKHVGAPAPSSLIERARLGCWWSQCLARHCVFTLGNGAGVVHTPLALFKRMKDAKTGEAMVVAISGHPLTAAFNGQCREKGIRNKVAFDIGACR